MNPKPRSLRKKVIAIGLVAGTRGRMVGRLFQVGFDEASIGTKAREALSKRWADYGETPRNQSRARHNAPVRQR